VLFALGVLGVGQGEKAAVCYFTGHGGLSVISTVKGTTPGGRHPSKKTTARRSGLTTLMDPKTYADESSLGVGRGDPVVAIEPPRGYPQAVSKRKLATVPVALCALVATLVASPAGSSVDETTVNARAPALYKNCTNFNKRYPHGVGKVGARDHTTGDDPVTNFKRSNKIYRTAMSWNKRLDGDKDGVACEQA
jgi:Excalibur calcium-binding domain